MNYIILILIIVFVLLFFGFMFYTIAKLANKKGNTELQIESEVKLLDKVFYFKQKSKYKHNKQ